MGIFSFLSNKKGKIVLSEVLGVEFGSTLEEAKKIMDSKPGCFAKANEDEATLKYVGLKFVGHDVSEVVLNFSKNKFHSAHFNFESDDSNDVLKLFNKIKSGINKMYYRTSENSETYVYPYKKENGKSVKAISLGSLLITSFWYFKNPRSDNKNLMNTITIYIKRALFVQLTFSDTLIYNETVPQE